jgi:hypothetical protein
MAMKISRYSVGNFASLYNRYRAVLRAYSEVYVDRNEHWCEENQEMNKLRQDAESALFKYLKALEELCDVEERVLTERLLEKKSLF